MASKAKKVATNLAKDLNETMQASIAYYTPEKASVVSDFFCRVCNKVFRGVLFRAQHENYAIYKLHLGLNL